MNSFTSNIFFNNNMGVIKYFIKLDITIFFFLYTLLFIDSIKELNIYTLCLIVMFYSYYRLMESVSYEVISNEKSIQLNWSGVIIDSKTEIHLNTLISNDEQCSSTSTEHSNFAEPEHVLEHLTLEHRTRALST